MRGRTIRESFVLLCSSLCSTARVNIYVLHALEVGLRDIQSLKHNGFVVFSLLMLFSIYFLIFMYMR